jgi:ribose transport system permease protein
MALSEMTGDAINEQRLISQRRQQAARALVGRYGTLVGILVLILLLSFLSPYFLTLNNWLNILTQVAPVIIIACGLTFAIVGGGFDLSLGAQASLATVAVTVLLLNGVHPILAILACLAVGIVVGTVNGFICGTLGVAPWVGTLAVLFLATGPQYIITEGGRVQSLPRSEYTGFIALGQAFIGPIPTPVIIAGIIALISHIFLTRTRIGYHIVAMGGDRQATALAGIPITAYVWLIYILSGLLASAGGVVLAARLAGSQVRTADAYLLDAIAAVYIGSTILKEGEPHILGTVMGTIFIGIMSNGITLLGVPFWGEFLFRGMMVFVAVMLSGIRAK